MENATEIPDGDAEKGKSVFKSRCETCHTTEQGGKHSNGPNLHGFYGRETGKAPGFRYSEANKNKGIIWNKETLWLYLERPSAFMPGTTMVFPGVRKPEDRANLIAYLQQVSSASRDKP